MNKTVVRSSLTEQVYMLIINKIQDNTLSQGDRINIEELARDFDVSRTPVREAINRLIQEGFVEQVHNVGPRIITLNKQKMLDLAFTNAILFTGILESLIGTKHKDKMVAELTAVLDKQNECLEKQTFEKYFLYAIDFHKVFINHCENQKLRQLTLQTQTQIDMFVLYYNRSEANRENSIDDHTKLLHYFIQDDYDNLISAMKEHNINANNYFKNKSNFKFLD